LPLPRPPIVDPEADAAEAIFRFNKDPFANIQFFCQHFERPVGPVSIAFLLHRTVGLMPQKVAEFLLKPGHETYMKAFFDQYELHIDFLSAFRRCFCGQFALPSEPELVEKSLNFAIESYMAKNPGIFRTTDDGVTLATALLMLNSKLVSKDKKQKMSRGEFVTATQANLRGCTLTPADLSAMYASLAAEPMVFGPRANDWMAACAPSVRGWLRKREVKFGAPAKNAYFVLVGSCLYFFKDNLPANAEKPKGLIELFDIDIVPESHEPHKFSMVATDRRLKLIKFKGTERVPVSGIKRIDFEAKTPELRDRWVNRLAKAASLAGMMDPVPTPKARGA
jgi:hypothetical protein